MTTTTSLIQSDQQGCVRDRDWVGYFELTREYEMQLPPRIILDVEEMCVPRRPGLLFSITTGVLIYIGG